MRRLRVFLLLFLPILAYFFMLGWFMYIAGKGKKRK